jgi:hypothetical protein
MILQSLAEGNRLRIKRDACGDLYIPGRVGEIYEYGGGRFAVTLMPNKPRAWPIARRRLAEAGFQLTQNGDREGTALFDPREQEQLALALKLVRPQRIRRHRPPSVRQLHALENGRRNRSGTRSAPQDSFATVGDDVGAIPASFQGNKACGHGSSSRAQLGGVSR